MSRYVVSLGGNALGNNADEQKEIISYFSYCLLLTFIITLIIISSVKF